MGGRQVVAHTAYVEFEVEVGEPVPVPEECRHMDSRTHYQPTRKMRLTAREQDVDLLIKQMTANDSIYLSEVSCAAGCLACERGEVSPF